MVKRKEFRSGRRRHGAADGRPPKAGGTDTADEGWLYGHHAVVAALQNPQRRPRRLIATAAAAAKLRIAQPAAAPGPVPSGLVASEIVERETLDRLFPQGTVHQGVALAAEPLEQVGIEDICRQPAEDAVVMVLDQVTDPHNVGAVLRSAAAFGAAALVITERNAPPASGALAKAASGALEVVPLVRVPNLARAIDALKASGFWCIGLDGGAERRFDGLDLDGRVALVLGAEGAGLRRLTAERCDFLARLPTAGPMDSLNVSNAAAVALYERARRR